MWHYIFSAILTKNAPPDCFLSILPTGYVSFGVKIDVYIYVVDEANEEFF